MPRSPVRELHVIGFTPDHGGLILAAKRGADTGSFLLEIDDDLIAHVLRARQESTGGAAGQPADTSSATPPARRAGRSSLTPREIQARLRAGRTVQEVAVEAGVGTDWIDRFAAPVLAEQAAAVARALEATLQAPRRGSSERNLEASVQRNLADREVSLTAEEFTRGWSAFHVLDSEWLVRFRFSARNRPLVAEWVYDMASGALRSRNRLAGEIGFVDSARRGAAAPALFDVDDPGDPEPPVPSGRSRSAQAAPKPGRGAASTKKVAATARVAPSGSAVVRRAVPPGEAATAAGSGTTEEDLPAGGQPGGAD